MMEPAATAPTGDAVVAAASSSLIFLGTGCSGALPHARCLIQPSTPACAVCSQALSLPPDRNPNYRCAPCFSNRPSRESFLSQSQALSPNPHSKECNTSLLIDYCHNDGTHKYILIDVGKTFREQVLRWFVHHKVPSIDSIILTHEHADAVLGLTDVWMVQSNNHKNDTDQVPTFLTQFTMDSVATRFPYLVKQKLEEGDEVARVTQLDWRIIECDVDKPFVSSGLEFVPLPV